MNKALAVFPESSVGLPGHSNCFRLLETPKWKRMDNLSMSSVLKRDGGRQLSLQMKLRDGNFEVLAVLERGNTTEPDADWARLQLRLAEHGVRMAPLVSGSDRASWYAAGRFPSSGRQFAERSRESLPATTATARSHEPGALRLSAALATVGRIN